MRTKTAIFPALIIALSSIALVASGSLAGIWQFPLTQEWNIDPEFMFGSPYGGEVHLGEDVEAPAGTLVYAAANGRVVFTGNFLGYHDWGGLVLVEHKNVTGSSVVSLYGHLDARTFGVRPGQLINRGQVLGKLGDPAHNGHWKTHVHFAIREGSYISSPWVYWGFASQAVLSRWEPAHTYVPGRASMKEVARVPLSGRNRYETAAAVSNWSFPTSATADEVFIVSGERFADALAATPLAHLRSAPLLLARSAGVPSETVTELQRVLRAGGAIHLVGGTAVLGDAVVAQLNAISASLNADWTIDRIAGDTAPATSVAVAQHLSTPTKAFIVSSTAFADGLSSGVPAARLGAPVLLTDPAAGGLSSAVQDYVAATPSITEVTIIGGTAAVAPEVHDALAALPQAPLVSRVAGNDRYETNRFTNERFFNQPELLVAATGDKFADALVGGALAARTNGALVLASYTGLRAQVQDYIAAVQPGVQLALVLGGTAALTQNVDVQIGQVLNAGFVGASIASSVHALPPIDWAAAPVVEYSGVRLLAPSGHSIDQREVGGAQTWATVTAPDSDELEAILASRLSATAAERTSRGAQAALVERWLGLAPNSLAANSAVRGRFSTTKGFAPRIVQVIPQASDVLVFVVPESEDAAAILNRLAELNPARY